MTLKTGNLRYMRELASKKKAKERKFREKVRKWAITGTAALGLLGVGLTKDMDFGYKPFGNFEKKDPYEITLQWEDVKPEEKIVKKEPIKVEETPIIEETIDEPVDVSPVVDIPLENKNAAPIAIDDDYIDSLIDVTEERREELVDYFVSSHDFEPALHDQRSISELSQKNAIAFMEGLEERFDISERSDNDENPINGLLYNSTGVSRFLDNFDDVDQALDFLEDFESRVDLPVRFGNFDFYHILSKDKDVFEENSAFLDTLIDARIYDDKFGVQDYHTSRLELLLTKPDMIDVIKELADKTNFKLLPKEELSDKDYEKALKEWESGSYTSLSYKFRDKTSPIVENAEFLLGAVENPEIIDVLDRLEEYLPVDFSGMNHRVDELVELNEIDDLEEKIPKLISAYPKLLIDWNYDTINFAVKVVSSDESFERYTSEETLDYLKERRIDVSDDSAINGALRDRNNSREFGVDPKILIKLNEIYGNFSYPQLEAIAEKEFNGKSLVEALLEKNPKKLAKEFKKKNYLSEESLKPFISGNPKYFFDLVENRKEFLKFYDKLTKKSDKNLKWLRKNDFMQGQNRLNQYMSVTEDLLQVYKDGDKFLDLVDLVEKDSDYRFMIKDTKGLSSLLTLDDEILQSSFGSLSSVGYVPSNNDLGELGGWFVKGPSLLAYQLGHEGVQDILSHSDFDRVGRIVYDKDYEGKFDFSDLGLLHAFTQDERLLRKYVSRDRDEMYEDVMTKLNRKSESKREVRDGFYSSLQDIRFVNSLSNTDLFKIEMLLDYLSSQNNVDAIHDNLMVDMADTTTEHGGQIVYDNGVRMNYIDAAKSENDGEYVIGEDFLDTVPYSLTDFHNHALPHDNTSFSGSSGAGLLGGGDLGVARKYQRDGVVFTLLNDDKFNVDFYTPQGYEVDLGVYERK